MTNKRIIALGKGSSGGGSTQWGQITGNISDQTDLQNVLNTIPTNTSDLNNDSGYRSVIELTSLTQAELADFYTNYATLITQNTYVINGYSFTVSPYKYEYQPGVELLILMSNVAGTVLPTNVYPLGGEMTLNCDLYYLAPNGVLQKDTDNNEYALVARGSDGSITTWDGNNNQTIISSNDITINGNSVATTNQIPTVNDATITIQQNGTTVGTFTTNDDSDTTINLTGGGGNSWYGTQEQFDEIENSDLDYDTEYYIAGKLDYNTDIKNTPYIPQNLSDLYNDQQFIPSSDIKMLIQDCFNTIRSLDKYLSREEYEALEQAGELEEDVIYHIEDTVDKLEMVVTFTDQSTATYNVYVEEPVQSSN